MTVACLGCGKPSVSWRCWACTASLAGSLGDHPWPHGLGDHQAAFTQTMADAKERDPDFDFDGSQAKARIEAEWQAWKASKKKAEKKVKA